MKNENVNGKIPTRRELYEEIEQLKTENKVLTEKLVRSVELPCTVGDEAVVISHNNTYYVQVKRIVLRIYGDYNFEVLYSSGDKDYIGKSEINKTIFFGENAKTEAEKALKEKGE